MSEKPRIAIVGAGLIGQRHAKLVAEHMTLDAIVDPSDSAKAFADSFGVRYFAGLASFLDAERPDGVVIATPNQLHAEQALACIEERVPILIEKPITDRAVSARQVIAAGKAANVPVLVGHHRRHNPLIAVAKAAIEAGRIGRPTVVNAQFWLYKPDDYYGESWRRQAGAGPVFINLIHDIDLLRHLCGEIRTVVARQSSAVRGFEVEDTAVIILEFENGAMGTVSVSDTVVAPWSWEFASGENSAYPKTAVPSYTIGGTEGSLSIPDLQLWTQPQAKSWWMPIETETLNYPAADPLVLQLKHFANVIAGRSRPLVSGEDGMRTLAVVEAIKLSAETGEAQALEPK